MTANTPTPTAAGELKRLEQLADKYSRTDMLPFRVPGTSRSEKTLCRVFAQEEFAEFVAAAAQRLAGQAEPAPQVQDSAGRDAARPSEEQVLAWMKRRADESLNGGPWPGSTEKLVKEFYAALASPLPASQGEQAITLPLADAQALLTMLDRHYGNDEGLDWFDEEAGAVADALAKAGVTASAIERAAKPAPALPAGEPIETILYWADAYAKMQDGHGMIIHLLREYAALRQSLAAAPQPAVQAVVEAVSAPMPELHDQVFTMKTDRELLELAARAHGFIDDREVGGDDHGLHREMDEDCGFYMVDSNGWRFWNPRDDSGQALELAVMLEMRVHVSFLPNRQIWVAVIEPNTWPKDTTRSSLATEYSEDDPCAATRLAIVRAAAEIGSKP